MKTAFVDWKNHVLWRLKMHCELFDLNHKKKALLLSAENDLCQLQISHTDGTISTDEPQRIKIIRDKIHNVRMMEVRTRQIRFLLKCPYKGSM